MGKWIMDRDNSEEFLVFRCPGQIEESSDNIFKEQCHEPICAKDWLETYVDKNSEHYQPLKNKIETITKEIYKNTYNRLTYCPTECCKNSECIILDKKLDNYKGD